MFALDIYTKWGNIEVASPLGINHKHHQYARIIHQTGAKLECCDHNYRYLVSNSEIAVFDQLHLELKGYFDGLEDDEQFLTIIVLGHRSYILTNQGLYSIYPNISYNRRKGDITCCLFPTIAFRKESLIAKVAINHWIRVMYAGGYAYVYYIFGGIQHGSTQKHTLMRVSFKGNILIHPNLGRGFIESNRAIYCYSSDHVHQLNLDMESIKYCAYNRMEFDIAHDGNFIPLHIIETRSYTKCRNGIVVYLESGTGCAYYGREDNFNQIPGVIVRISPIDGYNVFIHGHQGIVNASDSYIFNSITQELTKHRSCDTFCRHIFKISTLDAVLFKGIPLAYTDMLILNDQ